MPRNGELRFMIYPDLNVQSFSFTQTDFQKRCHAVGNCFKTRKEAEAKAKELARCFNNLTANVVEKD